MIPVNYPTPTDYQSTGPDIECAEITQLQEGRTNLPRRKMPKMVKNGKEWSKTFKNGANLCKNVPKSHIFRSLKPSGPDTKLHEMARNGTVLRNTEPKPTGRPYVRGDNSHLSAALPGGPLSWRRRVIMLSLVKGPEPPQKEHSFLIRFRRRNESRQGQLVILQKGSAGTSFLRIEGSENPKGENWRLTSVAGARTGGWHTGVPLFDSASMNSCSRCRVFSLSAFLCPRSGPCRGK